VNDPLPARVRFIGFSGASRDGRAARRPRRAGQGHARAIGAGGTTTNLVTDDVPDDSCLPMILQSTR